MIERNPDGHELPVSDMKGDSMSISYKFPIVTFYSDDLEDSEITYCEGRIKPIRLDREPYEITLEARGYSFHLIFGSQIYGNFLCIPNYQFGCELAGLTNKDWNLHSMLQIDSLLDYEDATAIVWGLELASSFI